MFQLYLNSLYDDNLLKDSTVILLNDHRVVIHSIYFLFDFYHKEKELPMLYKIINDRKNIRFDEQYCYIHENQQNYFTAYDIYNNIMDIKKNINSIYTKIFFIFQFYNYLY